MGTAADERAPEGGAAAAGATGVGGTGTAGDDDAPARDPAWLARFREERRLAEVPRFYSGWLHALVTATIMGGLTALCLSRIERLAPRLAAAVPLFFALFACTEYLEHRFLLHQRIPWFRFGYEAHTLLHHRFYTSARFRPDSGRDYFFVLFPVRFVLAYGLLVVPAVSLPLYPFSPDLAYASGFTACIYFFAYELIHLASHVGDGTALERVPVLRALIAHHRLHHDLDLMSRYNFGIVTPLWDWLFGTLKRP